MRKVKYIGLVLLLAATVCGCKSKTNKTSLYDRGLEAVARLEEMVQNDSYRQMYTMETYQDKLEDLKAGDYETPTAVYKATVNEDLVDSLVLDGVDVATIHNMSDELKEILNKKIFQSITIRMNSGYGTEAMAVASIFTDNSTFMNKDAKENVIYIYMYEDSYPVLVHFTVGDDHTVNAVANFLMTKEVGNSEKEIEELIKSAHYVDDCDVEKISK